jgi:putative colanic acid biosynthesis UDP-glucose lipid carrier transferase
MVITKAYDQLSKRRQLLKKRESIFYSVQVVVDLVLTVALLAILVNIKLGEIPVNYRVLIVTAVLLQFTIYSVSGVYRRFGSFYQGAYRLSVLWCVFLLVLLAIGFVTKVSESFSREVFLQWAVIGYVLQISTYAFMSRAIGVFRDKCVGRAECLIVGQGRLADHLYSSINGNKWLPDKVLGFVSFGHQDDDSVVEGNPSLMPMLGHISDIQAIIRHHQIKRVYIAVPLSQSGYVEGLHVELLDCNVDLIWVPDIYALKLLNHSIREVAGLPLIFLNESPITSTRTGILCKVIMDKLVCVFLLAVLFPLLLGIAYAIKRGSKGPAFFKQQRHGWDGKVFEIWKFRTMYLHDDEHVKQAMRDDDRITPIGRFLRRTSIDELPQLLNVLSGEMSLVGPRPHAIAHNDYYDDHIEDYLLRHRIKPGITGLAQINGCRGETEVIGKMRERVQFDVEYINNWSLWLDIKILAKTPFSLSSHNVY